MKIINKNNTISLIVAYNPDNILVKCVDSLIHQTKKIIIVDNTKKPYIKRMITKNKNIIIKENMKNYGIGKALNIGFKIAEEIGCDWVLTMDQDSIVDKGTIKNIGDIFSKSKITDNVGIIGINFRSIISGRPFIKINSDKLFKETNVVITSGSFCLIKCYDSVGKYNEEFFIEGVDIEYCLRAREKGYKIFITKEPMMTHKTGEMLERKILWKTILVGNHSKERYYLMIKNITIICKKYALKNINWFYEVASGVAKTMLIVILYENNKMQKVVSAIKGLRDGISKR